MNLRQLQNDKGALAAPLLILAIAAFVLWGRPVRADEELAHLHLRLTPCAQLPDDAMLHVSYEFKGLDTPGTAREAFDWKNQKGKTIDIDVDLPGGFYKYHVDAAYGGDAAHPPPTCHYPAYVGLLPGRSRTIADPMSTGAEDLAAPLLVMGTLPAGYSASLVRYAQKIDCGASTSGVPTVPVLRFESDDRAYYLYDIHTGDDSNEDQFGLTVTSPGGQKVTFVIQATSPSPIIGAPPAYVRYDVSAATFQSAMEHTPAGSAVCIGTPTT